MHKLMSKNSKEKKPVSGHHVCHGSFVKSANPVLDEFPESQLQIYYVERCRCGYSGHGSLVLREIVVFGEHLYLYGRDLV